jgi:O-glycosyl hydrolase
MQTNTGAPFIRKSPLWKQTQNRLTYMVIIFLAVALAGCFTPISAQEEVSNQVNNRLPLEIQYMAYRPAVWEEKALTEVVNERRNMGGLIFVYYTNTSDKPVRLREWFMNGREAGHFRLAYDIAWDRRYTETIQPGQTTVTEICGVSEDFQTGKPANFGILGRNWRPVARGTGNLQEEEVRISSMVIDSSLKKVTLHIRNLTGNQIRIRSVSVEGREKKLQWLSSDRLEGNGHVVARLGLETSFTPGELVIAKLDLEIEGEITSVYSHRNAYADYFPNGTWGIKEEQYEDAKTHHLNTMVKGGQSTDAFFSSEYLSTGLKAMPHTGIYPDVEMIRDLEDHPAVACWYLQDEPDWNKTPQLVMACNTMTRQLSVKKPTLLTLCRNLKFFEFAFIPDIPCHDHYSVTAPTTSKWPYVYGTRLEETGYYTADLKYAAEPKPVWTWTQGLHLWDERPKLPLPSPDELGAQLFFNLGRGAKGNLWFTFRENAGRMFPETRKALQAHSRLIRLLEKDLLLSDPYHGDRSSNTSIDVAPLVSADKMILFLTNTDYEIRDTAYRWKDAKDVEVRLEIPDWFVPEEAFEVDPYTGIRNISWKPGQKEISLFIPMIHMGKVVVFSNRKGTAEKYSKHFSSLLQRERGTSSAAGGQVRWTLSSELMPESMSWYTDPPDPAEIAYRLSEQEPLFLGPANSTYGITFNIDTTIKYQSILGIGTSLEATSLHALAKNKNEQEIREVISVLLDPEQGMGLNLFRVCIGTSDFSDGRSVSDHPQGYYTYRDRRDEAFSIQADIDMGIIRLLKMVIEEAERLDQDIKFFASCWSPPAWMKTSEKLIGGTLKEGYEQELALYFRQFIEAYESHAIPIHAITIQNEPNFTPSTYPGMRLSPEQEKRIALAIYQEFQETGSGKKSLDTYIWINDHNMNHWKNARKVLDELREEGQSHVVGGVAFHHYNSKASPANMSKLHALYPGVDLQMTEHSEWGVSGMYNIQQYFMNWSQSYMYWVPMTTLKLDEHNQGPYNRMPDLSPTLLIEKGIEESDLYVTPEYFLLSQFSRYIRPGAIRLACNPGSTERITSVAFRNPDNTVVQVLVNQTETTQPFETKFGEQYFSASLPPKTVGTFTWKE